MGYHEDHPGPLCSQIQDLPILSEITKNDAPVAIPDKNFISLHTTNYFEIVAQTGLLKDHSSHCNDLKLKLKQCTASTIHTVI